MNCRSSLLTIAPAVLLAGFALAWGGDVTSLGRMEIVARAEARIGRPATPMSYAGVARRTTRRAVAVGAGAYYAAPVVVAPQACTQRVDAYGRIVTVCY